MIFPGEPGAELSTFFTEPEKEVRMPMNRKTYTEQHQRGAVVLFEMSRNQSQEGRGNR
jgi:hypothetical protein